MIPEFVQTEHVLRPAASSSSPAVDAVNGEESEFSTALQRSDTTSAQGAENGIALESRAAAPVDAAESVPVVHPEVLAARSSDEVPGAPVVPRSSHGLPAAERLPNSVSLTQPVVATDALEFSEPQGIDAALLPSDNLADPATVESPATAGSVDGTVELQRESDAPAVQSPGAPELSPAVIPASPESVAVTAQVEPGEVLEEPAVTITRGGPDSLFDGLTAISELPSLLPVVADGVTPTDADSDTLQSGPSVVDDGRAEADGEVSPRQPAIVVGAALHGTQLQSETRTVETQDVDLNPLPSLSVGRRPEIRSTNPKVTAEVRSTQPAIVAGSAPDDAQLQPEIPVVDETQTVDLSRLPSLAPDRRPSIPSADANSESDAPGADDPAVSVSVRPDVVVSNDESGALVEFDGPAFRTEQDPAVATRTVSETTDSTLISDSAKELSARGEVALADTDDSGVTDSSRPVTTARRGESAIADATDDAGRGKVVVEASITPQAKADLTKSEAPAAQQRDPEAHDVSPSQLPVVGQERTGRVRDRVARPLRSASPQPPLPDALDAVRPFAAVEPIVVEKTPPAEPVQPATRLDVSTDTDTIASSVESVDTPFEPVAGPASGNVAAQPSVPADKVAAQSADSTEAPARTPAASQSEPVTAGPAFQPAVAEAAPKVPDTSRAQPVAQPVPVEVSTTVSALQRVMSGDGHIHIRLDPPELGTMLVDVIRGDDGVVARLELTTGAAHRAVIDTLGDLQQSLSRNGVTVDRVEVVLSENRIEGSRQERGQGSRDGRSADQQQNQRHDSDRERQHDDEQQHDEEFDAGEQAVIT